MTHVHIHFRDSQTPEGARKAAATRKARGGKKQPPPKQPTHSVSHLAASLNAPSHATIHENGGKFGHGSIGWAESQHPHADAHKRMLNAGFKRESSKIHTQRQKAGRSAAMHSSRVQESTYSHPSGHEGEVKTNTNRWSERGPVSYFQIHRGA
jgi:hypothetical protein